MTSKVKQDNDGNKTKHRTSSAPPSPSRRESSSAKAYDLNTLKPLSQLRRKPMETSRHKHEPESSCNVVTRQPSSVNRNSDYNQPDSNQVSSCISACGTKSLIGGVAGTLLSGFGTGWMPGVVVVSGTLGCIAAPILDMFVWDAIGCGGTNESAPVHDTN
jgi:predicted lipid-binding transport protein (Tim44 family)